MNHHKELVGQELQTMLSYLTRVMTDWDDTVRLWHHAIYKDLKANPAQYTILLTETPRNPQAHREKMTEIIFETFEFPAFYLALQPVLSLYSAGRTTGTVLESGDGATTQWYKEEAVCSQASQRDSANRWSPLPQEVCQQMWQPQKMGSIGLDGRFHAVFVVYLPEYVDHQTKVPREWYDYSSQKTLLILEQFE